MTATWTAEQTATHLNISPETLNAFMQAGIIPAENFDPAATFDPETVNKWRQLQLAAHQHALINDASVRIEENLLPERLMFSNARSKAELFAFLSGQAVKSGLAASQNDIETQLWNREALMSTGIGLGIAVPHLRLEQLNSVELFLFRNTCPIKDYDTMDNRPVEMIVFILVGKHMHKEYLKTLASVINLLKKEEIRTAALACTDVPSAHTIITGKF